MSTLYGIQPSGRLHIGNYLGGLRLAIESKATILIANYHALTSTGGAEVERNTQSMMIALESLGAEIELQAWDSLRLSWEIQCITPMSDLMRMTQWKAKADASASNVGLLTYPCLMAADIILSGADKVIIGEDQVQHMEFYRRTCERIGITNVAKSVLTDTPRIMSIKDPTKKMSKSLGDSHCLYLGDDEESAKKIKGAPTTPEGIANLKQIAKGLGVEFDENKCGDSKQALIEALYNIMPQK